LRYRVATLMHPLGRPPMTESDAELLAVLRALELELHQPKTRHDGARLGALLHDDFSEFGYSGNAYSRVDILARLPLEAVSAVVAADRFELARLGSNLALLTYRSAHILPDGRHERHSLRSSIWEYTDSAWQMRFHQGTPTSPPASTPGPYAS
jgi:hypothetical protein